MINLRELVIEYKGYVWSTCVVATQFITAVAWVGLLCVVVVVDVLCSDNSSVFCHRQLFIVEQFHLAKLDHVIYNMVTPLQNIGVVVDAFQKAFRLLGLSVLVWCQDVLQGGLISALCLLQADGVSGGIELNRVVLDSEAFSCLSN